MLKKLTFSSRLTFVLKSLLISYLLTAGLLLLLALFLYKFSLTEKIVSLCITGIYILVTFLAGFLAGKREGSRKFLWGLMMGCLYFIILTLVSLIVNHGMGELSSGFFTTLVLCAASGMLGGMLS
ncbi:MAG: TIGR04086 family membrane protein [Lachnospiraceae bacterium]|nr:TIGR04086 family membrane protein [Lachnospiraceae bacterium]